MPMNPKLQERKIRQMLRNQGVPSDKVDVKAMIDNSLRLPENIRQISGRMGMDLRRRRDKQRIKSFEWFKKAKKVNNQRSRRARRIDYGLRADQTFNREDLTKRELKRWMEKPNRLDIEGVDTFGGL